MTDQSLSKIALVTGAGSGIGAGTPGTGGEGAGYVGDGAGSDGTDVAWISPGYASTA